jgi:hypothetical protein
MEEGLDLRTASQKYFAPLHLIKVQVCRSQRHLKEQKMFQYLSYPIYVLYSVHNQEAADNIRAGFYASGDMHMYEWMNSYNDPKAPNDAGTGRALMEVTEDSAPAYQEEARRYEAAIRRLLDSIYSTTIGQYLFVMLDPNTKILIVPDPNLFWTATTSRILTTKQGGGIRIHINPEQFKDTADDTLIHELTHALRRSRNRFNPKQLPIGDFSTTEEFLATQVQNIYRSSKFRKGLYDVYNSKEGVWSDKGSIYRGFTEDPNYIIALRWCMDTEPLIRHASRFPIGNPEYNPFRDFSILERMALGKRQEAGYGAGNFVYLR